MYYTSKLIQAKKRQDSTIEDGFWIHKDTEVKTFFGSDAPFINNGVMSRPDWMAYAKEIRLCSGITGFDSWAVVVEDEEWGDWAYDQVTTFGEVLNETTYNGTYWSNEVLEKLDFGDASVQEVPAYLVTPRRDDDWNLYIALVEVILNDAVTTIGREAFSGCYSLTSIDLPAVTSIGDSAFSGCTSLTSIDLPAVTTIGREAFAYCSSLTSVEIGDKVAFIGAVAFGYQMSALTEFIIRATTPPNLGYSEGGWNRYLFGNINQHPNLVIKVPAQSVNTYKAATGWSTYATKITAI